MHSVKCNKIQIIKYNSRYHRPWNNIGENTFFVRVSIVSVNGILVQQLTMNIISRPCMINL